MSRTLPILLLSALILAPLAHAREVPFNRGVNLSNWFQADNPAAIDFDRYDRDDFERIRNLGADVIRLPINLHSMTDGAPDYKLDPLFVSYLDRAVGWAADLELHLILDNHSFDPATDTDPAVRDILLKVWPQLAAHYRDGYERLYYEILNEPHGIDDATWNAIQQEVVAAIREVDEHHTLIIGPAGWNSYHNLDAMPDYEDDNLIVTFHFYDPFLFTHQGATWVEPSMAELADMPFPYRAGDMPPLPDGLDDTWVGDAYRRYEVEGTVASVRELLEIAVAFREERDVPLFLGEFGVYMNNADDQDRVAWYAAVREILDEHDLAWTSWDYHGGFGLFESGSEGRYEHDLNLPLLDALGFDAPPQTAAVTRPETLGFTVFGDKLAQGTRRSGPGTGTADFEATDQPHRGSYAIAWQGPRRYDALGFDFVPDRDLAFLAAAGYELELQLRCDTPGSQVSVRFLDSDESPEDRPWRMGLTVATQDLPCDGAWHRFRRPLAALEEQGAWEAGVWYPPQGDFDWAAVDHLEVVSESDLPASATLWIDEVRLTRLASGPPRLELAAGLNGLFYDPERPGHGFDVNQIEGGLVVYYYGHTTVGERLWLVSQVHGGALDFNAPLALTFYEISDGRFGLPGPDVTPWGTITLTFPDCASARADFDGLDGRLSMDLVRLAGVPGLRCQAD